LENINGDKGAAARLMMYFAGQRFYIGGLKIKADLYADM
jgi:hypothetical protein